MNSDELTTATREEIKKIEDEVVRKVRKSKNRPCTMVACSTLDSEAYGLGKSGGFYIDRYDDRVLDRLKALGGIGGYRKECPYKIGHCAEPHAASEMLIIEPGEDLDNLVFGVAQHCRTKIKIYPYCKNCRDTFPQLPECFTCVIDGVEYSITMEDDYETL